MKAYVKYYMSKIRINVQKLLQYFFPYFRYYVVERFWQDEWYTIQFKDIKKGDIIRYKSPFSRKVITFENRSYYIADSDAYPVVPTAEDSPYTRYGCDVVFDN